MESDFMKHDTDDLLFGAMQYLATFHPALQTLYLTKKNLTKNKKEIYALCGLNSRTLKTHIQKLEQKGFLQERDIIINDNVYPSYIFPYDEKNKYQIIEAEMLWYIVSTRNAQAVRVYLILLDWYKWKKRESDKYVFTNKEIIEKLGFSPDNRLASSMISNILESFQREGVIDFIEFRQNYINSQGKELQIPRKRLNFVAAAKNQIRK